MAKDKLIISLLILLSVLSCKIKKYNFFWVRYSRSKSDTVYFLQTIKKDNNIEYIENIYNEDTERYRFNLKNSADANYYGVVVPVETDGKGMPMGKGNGKFIFVRDTTIVDVKDSIYVRKYLLKSDLQIADDGAYYYWSPTIGIILIKSQNWPISEELHASYKELDKKLTYIVQAIKHW